MAKVAGGGGPRKAKQPFDVAPSPYTIPIQKNSLGPASQSRIDSAAWADANAALERSHREIFGPLSPLTPRRQTGLPKTLPKGHDPVADLIRTAADIATWPAGIRRRK